MLKRSPGLNKCLDSSWEGPFVITELLPPVNCKLVPQGSKEKSKVVHLSQVKKAESMSVHCSIGFRGCTRRWESGAATTCGIAT